MSALAVLLAVALVLPPVPPPPAEPEPEPGSLYVYSLTDAAVPIDPAMAPLTTYCWLGREARGAAQTIGADLGAVVGIGGWGQAGINITVHGPRMRKLSYDPASEHDRVAYAAEVLWPEQGAGPWGACRIGALGHD